METRLDIVADLEELPRVIAWTDAFLDGRDPNDELSGKLHLVAEELVTNVINHGYPPGTNGPIRLSLRTELGGAVLRIEDEAPLFDPFAGDHTVDTDASVEDRDIGGLGLFLVTEVADRVVYTPLETGNRIEAWFGPEAPERETTEPKASPAPDDPPEGSSLAWRFAASFFFVFLVSLACATALNFLKFERVFLDTAARQYDSILRDARSAIEGSLGEGLTLASNFSAQVVIDKTVSQHDGAFHLLVQDTAGETLFTDATSAPHAPLPPGLAERMVTEEDGFTRFGDAQGLGVAIVLRQAGEAVGMLALTHDPGAMTAEAERLRGVLLRIALMMLALFAPFIALLSYAVMVPVDRGHRRLSDALSRITGGGDAPQNAGPQDEYALLSGARALDAALRDAANGGKA